MQSPGLKSLWLQSLLDFILRASTYFLHAGIFVGASLVGIARYIHDVPVGITTWMTLWSVALLLHGWLTWRKQEKSANSDSPRSATGVLRTVFVASALNTILWVMWGFATGAREAAPFHLTIFIALITVIVSGLILGRRLLYAHWLKEFQREYPLYFEETKAKRRENDSEALHLGADGEQSSYVDDTSSLRLEKR